MSRAARHMQDRRETYVSVDVETDGPCPGLNSMLSIGAVAFDQDRREFAAFEGVLETLVGAKPNPETMEWWKKQDPAAYAAARLNPRHPEVVMKEFDAWVRGLPGQPIFCAWPTGFDFTYCYWYFHRFLGRSPFGFAGIDVRSFLMGRLGPGTPYYFERPKELSRLKRGIRNPLPHVALNDAREQGEEFMRQLAWKPNWAEAEDLP